MTSQQPTSQQPTSPSELGLHSDTATIQHWTAIVAASPRGVIGRDGDMPWKLSSDLRRFKHLTLGHPIIMGRKTYESIGRPLPGRRNLVLSRGEHDYQGVEVVADVPALEAAVTGATAVFVVGGAKIYELLLPKCQTIMLTRVWTQTSGDTEIHLDLKAFRQTHSARLPQTSRDSMPTEFQIWERT